MKKFKLNRKEKGFTIIEVMIVLAIAGVIMLVIFLAVPSLQRNSRNTQRRSDVSHLSGLINEYISNNQGSLPTAIAPGTGNTAGTLYLGNEKFSQIDIPASQAVAALSGSPSVPAVDTVVVYSKAVCSSNAPTTTGASAKSGVLFWSVETSSGGTNGQCTQI